MDLAGIAIAGNIICDRVKTINSFPKMGTISEIISTDKSVGGLVPNTSINLSKVNENVPITVYGCVGNDEDGRFITSVMESHGIDCSNIVFLDSVTTSFCDVMSVASGERTFFSYKGANALFSPNNINIGLLSCKMFHLGYLLLLDSFDKKDDEFGTVAAHFLHDLQSLGIKTSIDLISDEKGDYQSIALPAIKYCDYVIINEVEASKLFGLNAYRDDKVDIDIMKNIMVNISKLGVKEKIIIHSKDLGIIFDVITKTICVVPSINIPNNIIKGSVGAGDTYCAGCLYGIYNDFHDKEILEFASGMAACNLLASNSIDGLVNKNQINKIINKYGRKSL